MIYIYKTRQINAAARHRYIAHRIIHIECTLNILREAFNKSRVHIYLPAMFRLLYIYILVYMYIRLNVHVRALNPLRHVFTSSFLSGRVSICWYISVRARDNSLGTRFDKANVLISRRGEIILHASLSESIQKHTQFTSPAWHKHTYYRYRARSSCCPRNLIRLSRSSSLL